MKIIEALKQLKVIEKRMDKNAESIQKYASMLTTEKPFFDTEEKQVKEVSGLLQANQDLVKEYLRLKTNIEHTNIMTKVAIEGKEYSISELLIIKRKLAKLMINTYRCLNDATAHESMSRARASDDRAPQIKRLYKEENKNLQLAKWQDLYDRAESKLEIVNATTDLIEL